MRLIALAVLLALSISAAHNEADHSIEEIHKNPWAYLGVPAPLDVLLLSALVSGLAIFYSIFVKSVSEQAKKITFFVIGAPIAISTAYLMLATVFLNISSETGGPVHWHADYEVWACGEKYELVDPTGIDNKIGSPTVHEHNDNRIHVEGVLVKKEEASLRNFFIQVGGNFDEGSLTFPTNEGLKSWKDGDLCNGRPGRWHVYVNGEELDSRDAHDYVMSPLTIDSPLAKIDRIKLVFTEKASSQINPELGGEP